jgi:hypothetical protein
MGQNLSIIPEGQFSWADAGQFLWALKCATQPTNCLTDSQQSGGLEQNAAAKSPDRLNRGQFLKDFVFCDYG